MKIVLYKIHSSLKESDRIIEHISKKYSIEVTRVYTLAELSSHLRSDTSPLVVCSPCTIEVSEIETIQSLCEEKNICSWLAYSNLCWETEVKFNAWIERKKLSLKTDLHDVLDLTQDVVEHNVLFLRNSDPAQSRRCESINLRKQLKLILVPTAFFVVEWMHGKFFKQ